MNNVLKRITRSGQKVIKNLSSGVFYCFNGPQRVNERKKKRNNWIFPKN